MNFWSTLLLTVRFGSEILTLSVTQSPCLGSRSSDSTYIFLWCGCQKEINEGAWNLCNREALVSPFYVFFNCHVVGEATQSQVS